MALMFDLAAEFEHLNEVWIRGLEQFDRQIAEDNKWMAKVQKEGLKLINKKAKQSTSNDGSKKSQISPKRSRSSANQPQEYKPLENDVAALPASSSQLETSEIGGKKRKPQPKNKDAAFDAPVRTLRSRAAKAKPVKKRSSKKVSNDENNIVNLSPPPPPLPLSVPSRTPDVPVVIANFPRDPMVVVTPLKPQKPAKPPRTNTPLRPVMVLAESQNLIHTSKASLVLSTEKVPRMVLRVTCSPLKMAAEPARKKSSKSLEKSSRGSKKKSSNKKKSSCESVEILAKKSYSQGSSRKSSREKRSRASLEVTHIEESLRSSLEDNNLINTGEGEDDGPPAKKFRNQPTKVDLTNSDNTVIIHAHVEAKGPLEANNGVIQSNKSHVVNLFAKVVPLQPRTRSRPSVTTDEGTNSEASVISESPSPKCPRTKVVRAKKAVAAATEQPVRGRMLYSLRSRPISSSVTPSSSSESLKSKKATKANIQRSSSCSSLGSQNGKNPQYRSNSFLTRNSPMPMTPAEKTEKRRIQLQEKEQKQVDVLKKREAYVKKTMEEKKKKREERMRKAQLARELQEQEAIKKFHQEQMRIKEQEELNHKLLIAQKLEREKLQREEDEKRYEAFLEMKRMQRLIRQQKAEEKRMQENERLEKERIAREAEELARIKKANEAKVLNTQIATPKTNLNVTVTLDSKQDTSVYDITLNKPQSKYLEPSANADNYGIEHLDSDESTDDEARPKKKIPRWASGVEFRKLVMAQIQRNVNIDEIFPHEVLLKMPNLVEIFGKKSKRFEVRSSSAHWSSPPYNMRNATPK